MYRFSAPTIEDCGEGMERNVLLIPWNCYQGKTPAVVNEGGREYCDAINGKRKRRLGEESDADCESEPQEKRSARTLKPEKN
jgi:hypothetical protein